MNDNKILLIGAGGHAKSCIDLIESIGEFEIIGLIDNERSVGTVFSGYKVVGRDNDLSEFQSKTKNVLIAIGHTKSALTRRKLQKQAQTLGFNFPHQISPRAYVAKRAHIGQGATIHHGAIVNSDTYIGNFTIINTNAVVEHDSRIGDFSHIATGALINGNCQVGNNTFIGSGTVLKQQVIVGDHCTINIGALIYKSIPDHASLIRTSNL